MIAQYDSESAHVINKTFYDKIYILFSINYIVSVSSEILRATLSFSSLKIYQVKYSYSIIRKRCLVEMMSVEMINGLPTIR